MREISSTSSSVSGIFPWYMTKTIISLSKLFSTPIIYNPVNPQMVSTRFGVGPQTNLHLYVPKMFCYLWCRMIYSEKQQILRMDGWSIKHGVQVPVSCSGWMVDETSWDCGFKIGESILVNNKSIGWNVDSISSLCEWIHNHHYTYLQCICCCAFSARGKQN